VKGGWGGGWFEEGGESIECFVGGGILLGGREGGRERGRTCICNLGLRM